MKISTVDDSDIESFIHMNRVRNAFVVAEAKSHTEPPSHYIIPLIIFIPFKRVTYASIQTWSILDSSMPPFDLPTHM